MDVDRITKVYVKMRERRAELKRAFEAEDRAIKAQMETLEVALLGHLHRNKVKSMASDTATVYTEEVMQVNVTDWDAYHAWMIAEGDLSGLERRVGRKFIESYADANEGELPPGVEARREHVVRIRVAST